MITKTIRLNENVRFHARPATEVALEAAKYKSVIVLSANEQIADATNALSIMSIAPEIHDTVDLIVEGPDEEEAAEALERLIAGLEA